MKAICEDGMVLDCGNYKAVDGGVVLTEDVKRKRVIGFVPNERLQYVLPDDAMERYERAHGGERTDVGSQLEELRDRIDRLEEAIERSNERREDRNERLDRLAERVERIERTNESAQLRDRLDRLEAEIDARSKRADADDRSTGATDDDAVDDEAKRVGMGGFDPVAIMAEQAEREETTQGTESAERTEEAEDTDVGTIDVGRRDPVAVVAEQRAAAEPDESGEPSIEERVPDDSSSGVETDAGRETELQRLDGLGSTYATRLREADIETLEDLRGADAETVAESAQVSESRAGEWIERARELSDSS